MRFLFLEPFCGGSHGDFAHGLAAHSRHDIRLETLPARFWKWRMRGAALHFAHTVADIEGYDGIIAGSLMSLADLTALSRRRPPALVYFHENQLTYPLAPGEQMDRQFGFTDISTALCAERVLFNSYFHRDRFFSALPAFIGGMPEFKPHWAVDVIRRKAAVRYPGCRFGAAPLAPDPLPAGPPIVIWNHRWEFDKDPQTFFDALEQAARRGADFRLAVLGEHYQAQPDAFAAAAARFGDRIVRFGYAADRADYVGWLRRGTVAVSTALQENFGIAMVEAMRHGCLPLLPHRLAYPEILPREFHAEFLYRSTEDLVDKLVALLRHPARFVHHRPVLAEMMARYDWSCVIEGFDGELERLARQRR